MFLATGTASLLTACQTGEAEQTPNLTAPQSGWSPGVDLPIAVQEIYPTAHGGRLHQAGGFIAEGGRITAPTHKHFSWAPGEESWREQLALPRPRHHPQLISFYGILLAIAGFESHSREAAWVMQSSGWMLSHSKTKDEWFSIPNLPAPMGEAVTGILSGAVHIAGGRTPKGEANASWQDHIDSTQHYRLSGINGQWEAAAPCPTARNSAAGAVINGALHIVGGRQVGGGNLAEHEVYDASEDRWRTAAPMPQAQGGLAAAALGGKLYAFGGEYFDNGGGVYSESWVYDPASDIWEALPDMPHPRHGLGAATLGEEIYMIGGASRAGGNDTSVAVDIFAP